MWVRNAAESEYEMKKTRVAFNGVLYESRGWVCIDLPADASVALEKRGRIPVTGTINGFPVRTSVFPTGDGGHFMLVNKEMQKGANAKAGDIAKVNLEADFGLRVLKLPGDLRTMLSQHPEAELAFERLSYSHRKEYVNWIEEAKAA